MHVFNPANVLVGYFSVAVCLKRATRPTEVQCRRRRRRAAPLPPFLPFFPFSGSLLASTATGMPRCALRSTSAIHMATETEECMGMGWDGEEWRGRRRQRRASSQIKRGREGEEGDEEGAKAKATGRIWGCRFRLSSRLTLGRSDPPVDRSLARSGRPPPLPRHDARPDDHSGPEAGRAARLQLRRAQRPLQQV